MFEREAILRNLLNSPLRNIAGELVMATDDVLKLRPHGHIDRWSEILHSLPAVNPGSISLNASAPRIGKSTDLAPQQAAELETLLKQLHPWRKGPFEIFGIHVDAEWRSDLKWLRLREGIQSLKGRLVLDVGCGNGYYICRMLGDGARFVLGVDPSQLFIAQFNSLRNYIPEISAEILPLRCEEFPFAAMQKTRLEFDSVFSMGILYHRKNPIMHLQELRQCLRPEGELVLETLIVTGDGAETLIPEKTYAKMPNVWCVPCEKELHAWLHSAGFKNVRTIDITKTTIMEQRSTDWMRFESLQDFLDPDDSGKTSEGHAAPVRIIVSCQR